MVCIVRVQCASVWGVRGLRARAAGGGNVCARSALLVCSHLGFNLVGTADTDVFDPARKLFVLNKE